MIGWPEGTTAIVTGAGRGIGLGIAAELATRGVHVVIAENDEETGVRAAASISESGGSATGIVCDVSKSQAVDALIDEVMRDRGRIDILVNNAGIVRANMLWNLTDVEWDAVIGTNLSSQFFTIRAVTRAWMKEHGGAIVNISSIGGLRGSFGQINYAAAKAGVVGLTKAAALELGRYGVRVNAIAPGTTNTSMIQTIMDNPKLKSRLEGEVLLGRLGEPADIAKAVAFLLSEDASWITGKVLVVDGGAYN